MQVHKNTVTLYDAGGLILILVFFGLPFGTIFDYLWNLVVISVALPFLPAGHNLTIGKGRRLAFCFFITLLGIIIDWAYFELTWDTYFGKGGVWLPAMSQGLQLLWIVLPLAMLGLANFALSYSFLKLERRQAIIFGGIMALFTAPWLLPTVPYWFGWV